MRQKLFVFLAAALLVAPYLYAADCVDATVNANKAVFQAGEEGWAIINIANNCEKEVSQTAIEVSADGQIEIESQAFSSGRLAPKQEFSTKRLDFRIRDTNLESGLKKAYFRVVVSYEQNRLKIRKNIDAYIFIEPKKQEALDGRPEQLRGEYESIFQQLQQARKILSGKYADGLNYSQIVSNIEYAESVCVNSEARIEGAGLSEKDLAEIENSKVEALRILSLVYTDISHLPDRKEAEETENKKAEEQPAAGSTAPEGPSKPKDYLGMLVYASAPLGEVLIYLALASVSGFIALAVFRKYKAPLRKGSPLVNMKYF